ncbi:MAG: hypothetical protein BWY68_00891 [bacterium ADurb.Bin400]|nr:MAG: hypothetical protein BWY68_00891 [bacterium ADurb.Bin400]
MADVITESGNHAVVVGFAPLAKNVSKAINVNGVTIEAHIINNTLGKSFRLPIRRITRSQGRRSQKNRGF